MNTRQKAIGIMKEKLSVKSIGQNTELSHVFLGFFGN